ncbi:hypothetical protein K469DRAFT_155420 [Zopfia rhizophila CBS 207.26]|uniref:Uncharacterized protein n=1 Tax=Zopfia rhizophila CBS 207.26 TaxID=1314779 RepID=A0A6A6E3H0_9PEZI|nr:hypothetical protein K469DRAFT_155420 [Zopfia rhizophila CBS 207.26]
MHGTTWSQFWTESHPLDKQVCLAALVEFQFTAVMYLFDSLGPNLPQEAYCLLMVIGATGLCQFFLSVSSSSFLGFLTVILDLYRPCKGPEQEPVDPAFVPPPASGAAIPVRTTRIFGKTSFHEDLQAALNALRQGEEENVDAALEEVDLDSGSSSSSESEGWVNVERC